MKSHTKTLKKYFILDELVSLNDLRNINEEMYSLSPEKIQADVWYRSFKNQVAAACGNRFLPVCRLSDGEYTFLFGERPPLLWRWSIRDILSFTKYYLHSITRCNKGLHASTIKGVSSGDYSSVEISRIRHAYKDALKKIFETGYLALHLTFTNKPFQQKWHKDIGRYLKTSGMRLTINNYIPSYFVYHLFSSTDRFELFENRRVVVVTGSPDSKYERVEKYLRELGAHEVCLCRISANRSLFDTIDTDLCCGKVDLAIVAAGIGKPNIILQMAKLNIPCIDMGYMFEVYADHRLGLNRIFCELL